MYDVPVDARFSNKYDRSLCKQIEVNIINDASFRWTYNDVSRQFLQ